MKLLFDENISFRIVKKLNDYYPGSVHVNHPTVNLKTDEAIWQFAKDGAFTIVTFDEDFFEINLIKGSPPKVIWLRIGNTSTDYIAEVFISQFDIIKQFIKQEGEDALGCLEIHS